MNFLADQALYIYGFESQISFELCLLCLTTPEGEPAVAPVGA